MAEIMAVPAKHKSGAPRRYNCAIITISTSKHALLVQGASAEELGDISGERAKELLQSQGHEIVSYALVPDDEARIYASIQEALRSEADFIITSGGTGLTKHDVTIEVVSKLLTKEIPGFGELFRLKSYEEIGTATVLSRAIAGVLEGKVIFCLPGSPNAVRLALVEIILPELGHIMKHVRE
jgi:molybdenum cofactor biosynthesis protein B